MDWVEVRVSTAETQPQRTASNSASYRLGPLRGDVRWEMPTDGASSLAHLSLMPSINHSLIHVDLQSVPDPRMQCLHRTTALNSAKQCARKPLSLQYEPLETPQSSPSLLAPVAVAKAQL